MFFAPGCDHCQLAAKQIKELQDQIDDFPEVYVVFLDEEPEKIPDFLKKAGADFKYEIMDIYNFMEVFLIEYDTPGIVYQTMEMFWSFIKAQDSGSSKHFTAEALKKILENR